MDRQKLAEIARRLVADDKGLLAMDESTPTCNKRFAAVGIATTEENRRAYREMIVTTPRLGECISGAILFDETIGQSATDGTPFLDILEAQGILAGVKLDAGAKNLAGHAGEKVTEGLDGLRERIAGYVTRGLTFAKWRAVIAIAEKIPSRACVEANAHALARYAALCQEGGLVPIVEPEVLMDGDHDLAACLAATEKTLDAVFAQLRLQGILLEGMLLKPNMVVSGLACPVPGERGRGRRGHADLFAPPRSRRRAGRRLPVRRPVGRAGFRAARRDEPAREGGARRLPLGDHLLLCAGHPAAGARDLAGRSGACPRGAKGAVSSRLLQQGRPTRRIRCDGIRRDGECLKPGVNGMSFFTRPFAVGLFLLASCLMASQQAAAQSPAQAPADSQPPAATPAPPQNPQPPATPQARPAPDEPASSRRARRGGGEIAQRNRGRGD